MKKLYDFIKKPPVLIPLSVFAYIAVGWILFTGRDNRWYSYVFYLLSAVALVLDAQIAGALLYRAIMRLLMKIPFTNRLITDFSYRQRFGYYASIAINVIYIAINVFTGIKHAALWPFALGAYYTVLFLLRLSMVRGISEADYGVNLSAEYRQYMRCGIILLLLDATLGAIITLMVLRGFRYTYSFNMCIVMAMYVFYYVIFALVQLIRFRRYKSPLLSAVRTVTFVSAMLSVLALETAMLSQFGDANSDLTLTFIAVTGLVIVLLIIGMGTYMIVRGYRRGINL